MKLLKGYPVVPAVVAGVLCILLATPVAAHPGSLWGIDLTSVLSMRDKTRVIAHHHDNDEDSDEDQDLVSPRGDDLEQIRTIVIDPGHGGNNSGAIGFAGIPEKRLTLELAFQLREQLQEQYPRLRVVMTRYWDASVDLDERARIANLANADLFISLHYNAAVHNRAVGFETYFLSAEQAAPATDDNANFPAIDGALSVDEDDDTLRLIEYDLLRAHSHELSAELAESIQSHFVRHVDSVNRGVKQGNFAVLREAEMPAVVVEAGFMTHPEEGVEILTDDHQSRVITALIEAVEDFDTTLSDHLDVDDADHDIDEPMADSLTLR